MTESNPYQTPQSAYEAPQPTGTDGTHREPYGLGGWLILLGIGIVLSPFRLAAVIVQTYLPLFQDGTWGILTTPSSEHYHALWAPLLSFEIAGNLAFLVTYSVLAFLFFRKSRFLPRIYIAATLLNLCFVVLDSWFASLVLPDEALVDADTAKEIARAALSSAIWVPYMLLSKRVKNTFVE